MFRKRFTLAAAVLLLSITGCQQAPDAADHEPSATTSPRPTPDQQEVPDSGPAVASGPAEPQPAPSLETSDLLPTVLALHARTALPEAEFETGAAEPLAFDADQVTRTDSGFSIQLPSKSPIPTPTIYRGRLYVSGGFSSEEYYCFDAKTGDLVWAVKLDDDGPSSAVPYEDSILFGCESCTIFALAADSGQVRWSHWLGDPLISMPTVAAGRVYTAYPASAGTEPALENEQGGDEPDELELQPTHIAACFDARTGEVVWRKWLDSDCMTAPVATSDQVLFTTLSGNVFQFSQDDGTPSLAQRLRATSVPVIVDGDFYLTRRADDPDGTIAEAIVRQAANTPRPQFVAARRPAPYLDQAVQRKASYSLEADAFEAPNGIGGGGFGGGFGGGGMGSGFGGGGQFAVQDQLEASEEPPAAEIPTETELQSPSDALGVTELQAAGNVGLGNVSTLQSFQGSRILAWGDKLFSSMGDQVVCVKAETGQVEWTRPIEGNLEDEGGHLATPPIAAGDSLLVATVQGKVLQLSPQNGQILASYDCGSAVRFPPVVDGGRIYVGTQDGRVVCIDTGNPQLTGWPMWGGGPQRSNVRP